MSETSPPGEASMCGNLFPSAGGVPERWALSGPVIQRSYLSGGRMLPWDGPMREVHSPVCLAENGTIRQVKLGEYPLLGAPEALSVLAEAFAAFGNGRGKWPTMPVAGRIRAVADFLFAMREQREEVVKLLMWEIGKKQADAEKEFDRTCLYISDTLEAVKELDRAGSRFSISEGILAQIRRAPLGVTLSMGPFNYPLNETMTTLIPALVMGNTAVVKPAKHGVLLWGPLLAAFRDCFPPGVANVIYGKGSEIASPIMGSGKVSVLAFIGTSRVADALRQRHPQPHRLRCVLGTEAKNPAIVLPDADLSTAVSECVSGALSYNGQRCTALKIIFVHERVAQAFLSRFCEKVNALVPGMPWTDGVGVTPLPEPDKPGYLEELVKDAQEKGASVVNPGGGRHTATFFSPAVLYPVTEEMRAWHEEQFGPVVPVAVFRDLAEPLRYVEKSPYGQQVAIFGKDPDVVAKLIDGLVNQVCRVNVNSQCQRGPDTFPFTGRKDSAEGTLSVSDALRVFSIRTLVAAKENDFNKEIINDIVRGRKSGFLSTDFIL
ncbi:MAG: NADP-dependent glyceraldehyde-3-phosphate dehydrogenase [Thermodesulfobacteriota bacterium]